MLDGLCKLIRGEGPRGLLRGAAARMAFHAPMSAFGIALFEGFRILWAREGSDDGTRREPRARRGVGPGKGTPL